MTAARAVKGLPEGTSASEPLTARDVTGHGTNTGNGRQLRWGPGSPW